MKPKRNSSKRWDPRRPIWLDDIPATLRYESGWAVVRTVGRARSARFAWGVCYGILDKDGRFRSSEGVA